MELHWLPKATDFRGALHTALADDGPAACLDRLSSLAQHQLGFVETIQLDREASRIAASADSDFAKLRVALLGSVTVDQLLAPIRVAGLRRRMLIETYICGYGQHRQELLDPASGLGDFAPDVIVLSLSARDFFTGLHVSARPQETEQAVATAIEELRGFWRTAREIHKASVIQQTFLNVAYPVFGSLDRTLPAAPSTFIARLNSELGRTAASEGVLLLDVARTSEVHGLDAWFDVGRWLQAKQEIAPQSAAFYGDMLARLLAAQRGLSRKCLVLDLDNTLWGGIVGDDGIEGIVIGQGTAVGEAHLALQAYALQLKQRGIILGVCSKNEPGVAEAVFRDHPEMLLRRDDIAAFKANWQDKVENLVAIAEALNIGLDSLVFVDDNPVERARVRQALPMVAVPELPADCANYVRCLADAGYFEAVSFTAEDLQRADQYAANARRDRLRETSVGLDEFLRSLDMKMAYAPVASVDLQRVSQLINKTNQFNPTTRRYTPQQIASLSNDAANVMLQFRLVDKFGDNGVVSAMILRRAGDPGTLELDTWVMSCRVFGRQLEVAAMNVAVSEAARSGARMIRAAYIPTPKNGVVRELYPGLGFHPAPEKCEAGATWWQLEVESYEPRQTWIETELAS